MFEIFYMHGVKLKLIMSSEIVVRSYTVSWKMLGTIKILVITEVS